MKMVFCMDLKIWPGGIIPFMTRAVSEEDAKLQAQNFLFLHRWKGRVGEVKCLEPSHGSRPVISFYGAKTHGT